MKTIIVYKSKYGSSRKYALWMSDALKCEARDIKNIDIETLSSYEAIIYVGGIYAGRVSGFRLIRKNPDVLKNKKLVLCMVGMTDPDEREKYNQIYKNNVPEQYHGMVKYFSLRGDQLFSKMNFMYRLIMKGIKAEAEKKPVEQRTPDDINSIENFGKDMYFSKRENILNIVEYIKTLN